MFIFLFLSYEELVEVLLWARCLITASPENQDTFGPIEIDFLWN